jgi:hypothetical protein
MSVAQTYEKTGINSKDKHTSNLPSLSTVNNDMVAEICHDLVFPKKKGVTSVLSLEEFSSLIQRGERHARRYLDGELALTVAQFISVAQAAFWRGDRKLLNLALPRHHDLSPIMTQEVNGEVTDEVTNLVKFGGRMAEAYERGDLDEAQFWNDKSKEALGGVDCEIAGRKDRRKAA